MELTSAAPLRSDMAGPQAMKISTNTTQSSFPTDRNGKENGSKADSKVQAKAKSQLEIESSPLLETSKMVSRMGEERLSILLGNTVGILLMGCLKERGQWSLRMETYMKDNGRMGLWRERE